MRCTACRPDIIGISVRNLRSRFWLKGAISSGVSNADFVNMAAGGNYYFPTFGQATPYLTGDIGYGYAKTTIDNDDAEGFSFGVGAGFQFWRFADNSLDVSLRYAVIASPVKSGGDPAILGARVAVNF